MVAAVNVVDAGVAGTIANVKLDFAKSGEERYPYLLTAQVRWSWRISGARTTREMNKEIVLNSLTLLIAPIVRLCLKHGIKLGELIDALKRVFIEQACKQLERSGDSISNSRITLMTGVHRTDVAAIRVEPAFEPKERHTASDVISQWRYDKRFCLRHGKPRPLHFDGKTSEFADLVKSVSNSVSPYTVAFELERLGMIKRSKDGRLSLVTRVYVPKGDPQAILEMLGEDANDLYQAVEQNAFRAETQQPNHHLKTEYRNVPAEALADIQLWLSREGSALHERARNYLSRFDRDLNPEASGAGTYRVAIASFSLVDSVEAVPPQTTPSLRDRKVK